MTRKQLKLGSAILAGILLIILGSSRTYGITPSSQQTQKTFTITGTVVNGTAGATVPADLTLTFKLGGFNDENQPVDLYETTTQLKNDYTFTFTDIPYIPRSLGVIETEYGGVRQVSPAIVPTTATDPDATIEVTFTVYEVTIDPAVMELEQTALLIDAVSAESASLTYQIFIFNNISDRIFIDAPESYSLKFPMPLGSSHFAVTSILIPPDDVVPTNQEAPNQFDLREEQEEGQILFTCYGQVTTPILPGWRNRVMISYGFRFLGGMAITQDFAYELSELEVYVFEQRGLILESDQLVHADPLSVSTGTYLGYKLIADSLPEDQVLHYWIQDPIAVLFTHRLNPVDPGLPWGILLEPRLIEIINSADTSIDAALFELDSLPVADALIAAANRGVSVRLVTDDENGLQDPDSAIQQLLDAGIPVVSDERSGLMHNMYFVIDDHIVWTGSASITDNGLHNNDNNTLLIYSPELAANYKADFEEMFVDGVFNAADDSRAVPNRTVTIGDAKVETYFLPEDSEIARQRVLELVGNANDSITVMAFSFTWDELGAAIIERFDAGIPVRGVFETTGSLQGQMTALSCAGIEVRQDNNPRFLHHKVIIIDRQTVITGSANFTNSALDSNNENLLIIHSPIIAGFYMGEFGMMFDLGQVPAAEDIICN